MITTHFNQSKRYLESKVDGPIHLQEFIDNTHNILRNKSYPKKLRILDDHRNADYLFTPEDIDKILETLLEDIDNYKSVKHAILVNSPKETAYTYLFFLMTDNNKIYKLHIFNEAASAIDWLLS